MPDLNQPNFHAHRARRGMFIAALCVGGLVRVAYAAEPLMNEQNVNEQSIINALTLEKADDSMVRQGVFYRQPGLGSDSLGPARGPAVGLLITFATNPSTLTNQARAALDKVAHALQSAQLSGYKFRWPSSG